MISKMKRKLNILSGKRQANVEMLMLQEFDHAWFKQEYVIHDCEDRRALFKIYKERLKTISVSPNNNFNESFYLSQYADVRDAVKASVYSCGFEHYLSMGRQEGRVSSGESYIAGSLENNHQQMKILFDKNWYLKSYPLAVKEMAESGIDSFEHYRTIGAQRLYSPNSWFDENWYLSFYQDANELVKSGQVKSGFEHFVKFGQKECRIPHRKVRDILEFKYPGLINPSGIERASQLESKLKPSAVQMILRSEIRINFVLPTLDKDIMFGGYAAILQLLRKVLSMGFDIRILITEDAHLSSEYAWYNLGSILENKYKNQIEFENITHRNKRIELSRNDRFVAYSTWTALIASDLAAVTDEKKFLFLIQEDERIFHHNDSVRTLIEYAYSLPHVALFNSNELQMHFRKNRLGNYENELITDSSTFAFEHVLTPVVPRKASEIDREPGNRLLFYARPESHAARNIFEIGFLGLKEAVKLGYFDRTWSFDAVGTLIEKRTLDIGNGFVLNMMPKLDGGAYGTLLAKYDVGMSLMYAPHPGLVHYEMAAAGMVVVTNTYEQRDEDFFKKKSTNFVVTKPTIHGIAESLRIAVKKSYNVRDRIENAYQPQGSGTWDQVFTSDFISRVFSSLSITKK